MGGAIWQVPDESGAMTLRVIGAGYGRTGTSSLKLALERLLGEPCYHMSEVFDHPEHVPVWYDAGFGKMPGWSDFLAGYGATVDWPASAFWPELSAAFPDALVLLSLRDPEAWWRSASSTIFAPHEPVSAQWQAMDDRLSETRFTPNTGDRESAIAAFEAHNARVQAEVPRERLLEWWAGDGWAPLCAALGLPVPPEPFPHVNTKAESMARRETREWENRYSAALARSTVSKTRSGQH